MTKQDVLVILNEHKKYLINPDEGIPAYSSRDSLELRYADNHYDSPIHAGRAIAILSNYLMQKQKRLT